MFLETQASPEPYLGPKTETDVEPKLKLLPSMTAVLNYRGNTVTQCVLFAVLLPPVRNKIAKGVQLGMDLVLSCQVTAKIN